jgi:alanine racemase
VTPSDAPLVWAEIDLKAIENNVRELRRRTGETARFMAVVKADAYGHGAVAVARRAVAAGAHWLGVARIDEGIGLRRAGLDTPILVFGYTPPERIHDLLDNDLSATVYALPAAAAYARAAASAGKKLPVHFKVDTGMGRLGLLDDAGQLSLTGKAVAGNALREIEAMTELPGLAPEGIYTHFAAADSADKAFTHGQMERFSAFLTALEGIGITFPLRHAANSAAIIECPETHLDMVRAGIALYGLPPSDEVGLQGLTLTPAMAIKARIIHLKQVPAGFKVSYGMTWQSKHPTCIATIPIGYADGFSRLLSSKGEMLVRGRRAPIVGRVCMDLTMLDVGHIPQAAVGDEVVVIGQQGKENLSADEIAELTGTINYEVVTAISARVPRVYTN